MDQAHRATDRTLRTLEKQITQVYREAQMDLEVKLRVFRAKFEYKARIHEQELKDGKITKEDYQAWLSGQVFQGKQWQSKLNQITNTLTHADVVAQKLINGQINGVFANNANWQNYQMEHVAGINFGFELYDSSTVARLLRKNPRLLPKYRLDIPKDQLWNQTLITRQITQGIIQGERLDQIAQRLEDITDRDKNLCLTRARTAMTGAQNAGRQEALERAADQGIKTKKEWVATLDGHTRTNHRRLDGQQVDLDEPFKVGNYKIRYPGDPQAKPAMVYNCRCTMISVLVDYPDKDDVQRYDNIEGKPIKNMTYREWMAAKGAKAEPPAEVKWRPSLSKAQTVKEAVDISRKFAHSVSFPKVTSIEGMNELNGTLEDLTTRFPIDKLQSLKANGRLSRANARANGEQIEVRTSYLNGEESRASSWTEDNNLRRARIEQYKKLLGDFRYDQNQLRKAIKEYEEDLKYSRWSVSSGRSEGKIARTIAHEYGHVLADQYFGQLNGSRVNPNYSLRPDNPSYLQCKKVLSVYKKAMSSGDIYKISRYASSNEEEFWAETFAMYATGEELPDYINDMIEEVLKNGKL